MKNLSLTRVAALCITLLPVIAYAQTVNDGHGKEWRQVTDTTGVTWNQIAQVCPHDGVSPCSGKAGSRDLTGWVWATRQQVLEFFSYYEPAILTSPAASLSGQEYFFSASSFLSAIRPTYSFALTYQTGQFVAGWTASTDTAGLPILAFVQTGTTPVSISGAFGIGPSDSPDAATGDRGVFLWRSTGLGGGVVAHDDSATGAGSGGQAVASVLANDWFSGAPATTANVTLSQNSSSSTGVTLNVTNGSVNVFPGTPAGTYTLVYQICATSAPAVCDQAKVTVVVPPASINAVNDQGSASPSTGGVAIPSVLLNDSIDSAPATTAKVTLSQQSSTSPGVTLDLADGSVDVAPGTAAGVHTLIYQICETINPSNCDPATATVTVQAHVVNAVNDYAKASSKIPGTAIPSVLANDTIGGVVATTANVGLSLVSLSPPTRGIRLDTSDGSVDITRQVNSLTYKLVYKICELASPSNCGQATVTLELSGGRRDNDDD